MMTSRDEKVRTAMRQLTEDERIYRRLEKNPGESFLNWRDEHGRRGTTSLAAGTRKTCQALNIRLKLEAEEMVVRTDTPKYKTKIAIGIGRFLTQKVIRPRKLDSPLRHEVHGASFATLPGNEISNTILMNMRARRTDAFFRYAVAARADCLPMPVNIGQWDNRSAEPCRRCDRAEQPFQAHILNGCRANDQRITNRNNQLAGVVRRAIVERVAGDVTLEIRENTTIPEDGLSQEVRDSRPDLVFRGRENQRDVIEIIEFSCPCDYMTQGENALKRV
jgi:hypothetical protein